MFFLCLTKIVTKLGHVAYFNGLVVTICVGFVLQVFNIPIKEI